MKSLVDRLVSYAEYHRDKRNLATHFVGIPMILVDMDTLQAVEKTDELVGRVRIHQAEKVQRFYELVKQGVDIDALFKAAGIS